MKLTKSSYSIGEVATLFNLSVPTLRYYDQEGLIPGLKKDKAGNRIFNLQNIDAVQMIECLKAVKMPLKDIKRFMQWNMEGDRTLNKRLELFNSLNEQVSEQIKQLTIVLKVINYKQHYYQQAIKDGTEKYVSQNKTLLNEIMEN